MRTSSLSYPWKRQFLPKSSYTSKLIQFHKDKKSIATVTAVQQPGRFGILNFKEGLISEFNEKPSDDGTWINGGYFVLEPQVFDYIENDSTIWEKDPLETLVKENQLQGFKHKGFWHPIDTMREKNHLESLWNSNKAPWKNW